MRLDAIKVRNFRGLRSAEASNLSKYSLVTVSGPNGSGKSLLFEALTFWWRSISGFPPGQWDLRLLVGPWDEHAEITVTMTFTEAEAEALADQALSTTNSPTGSVPEKLTASVKISRELPLGRVSVVSDNSLWHGVLASPDFREKYAFAHLDYLPADRGIQRGEQAQINPAMLSWSQSQGLRDQVFNSFIQNRQVLTLAGVQPFLASLDYLDLLSDREEKPSSGDFDAIAKPFLRATGKAIHRPRVDPSTPFGAILEVETASGARHSLDQLSSGEQEVLALMFYVRRLSSSGGLLLVDEPELHLHPALQQSLFSVMESIAQRAQIWIVTHSAKLVTSAPLGAILHMSPTDGTEKNQLAQPGGHDERAQLLSDLGVHPIDALQSDSLVVVEGEQDAKRLPAVLSLSLSRSTIYVAGSSSGVEATARSLQSGDLLLPWIAIRDRDLLTDEDVQEKIDAIPGLFVWPNRMLENELLHAPLVKRTLERAGQVRSLEEVRAILKELAEKQRPLIVAGCVEEALWKAYPYDPAGKTREVDGLRGYFQAQVDATRQKIDKFEDYVESVTAILEKRWEKDWFKLMDGKRALREFGSQTPYKKSSLFVDAIMHTLREEPNWISPGLLSLQERIEALT